MGRRARPFVNLSDAEIDRALAGDLGKQFPPILTVDQAAELGQVSPKTLYDWNYRGLLRHCASRRGKHLRIFRDRFIRFLFTATENS